MPKVSERYKEQKQEAILEGAAQCFAHKGFSDTTVDDIANASGTSKGSIYLYFSSKEEIFYKLNERRTEKFFGMKERLSELNGAQAKLDYFFQFLMSGTVEKEDFSKIAVQFEFFIYISKNDKKNLFEERAELFKNFMKEIIEEGVHSGEFRSEVQVNEFSRLFWAMSDGIVLHLLFHKSDTDYKEMLRLYEHMVHRYLKN